MKCIFTLLVCITLLGAFTPKLQAQVWPDSKGTDFWLTYLPNFHNSESAIGADPLVRKEHELYLYIGAERPTSGTITVRYDDGTTNVIPFSITDVRVLFTTSWYYRGIELRGIGQNGNALEFSSSQNEQTAFQSVHVQALDDVTVYALNQARLTSDAFLVLPTDAVAEDYVVMSYPSDIRTLSVSGALDPSSTPSQFAVVATEDSTTVDITPSFPTPRNPGRQQQRVVLDKGESYLVQADMRLPGAADLTGSLVRASKPVALFSGHQRTVLPLELRGSLASRDCLVEQISPVRTWGTDAYVFPPATTSDDTRIGYDLYRVLAAFDSTAVSINGIERTILKAGEFFEDSLLSNKVVNTSRPALTAMFKKTSGSTAPNAPSKRGDPFMMLVPPAEQFMDAYRFVSIQAYDWQYSNGSLVPANPIYTEQWCTVVIPSGFISTLLLDGVNVQPGVFSAFGATGFSIAHINLSDGVHEIRASVPFGIYVYGYGIANSYGYIGGMSFRPLDKNPPQLRGEFKCNEYQGIITDSLIGDSRIASIAVVPGSEVNTIFTLGSFVPPQPVVSFRVALQNLYLDGALTIQARDVVGLSQTATLSFSGFTVSALGAQSSTTPATRDYIIPVGRERCDSLEIENYGLYPKTITRLAFTSGTVVTTPQAPFNIAAGNRITVRFCRTGTAPQIVSDTLVIGDTCLLRAALVASIEEKLDKDGPQVLSESDPCLTKFKVKIDDERNADLGLKSARILDTELVNCTVAITDSTALTRSYVVDVIDPYLDAIYAFEAVDSADNITLQRDTIPGFMISIGGSLVPTTVHVFGTHSVGSLACDTIDLANQSIAGFTINDVYIYGNTRFSIPRYQFPIYLAPLGGTSSLIVCFEPIAADTSLVLMDSVDIRRGCLVRRIQLQGVASPLQYQGITRCDVPTEATISVIGRSLVSIPQPAEDVVKLVLSQPAGKISVKVTDLTGAVVVEHVWHGEPTRAVVLNVSNLRSGTYGCIVTTESNVLHTLLIVR